MNELYFEYCVPSICCTLYSFFDIVLYKHLSCCILHLQLHVFCFFFFVMRLYEL